MSVQPSQTARDLIGKTVKYSEGDKEPVDVLVLGAERTCSVIRREDGTEWPGVRLYLKFPNGRKKWTCSFADEESPIDQTGAET